MAKKSVDGLKVSKMVKFRRTSVYLHTYAGAKELFERALQENFAQLVKLT